MMNENTVAMANKLEKGGHTNSRPLFLDHLFVSVFLNERLVVISEEGKECVMHG